MRPTRNLVSARATPAKPTLRMASRFRTGLAPGGVCLAPLVTEGAVRFYRTVSPVPDALRRQAVYSLLHFPSSHLDWPLASTLPCGARTFLDGRPKATAATTCPARARSTLTIPPRDARHHGPRPSCAIVVAVCDRSEARELSFWPASTAAPQYRRPVQHRRRYGRRLPGRSRRRRPFPARSSNGMRARERSVADRRDSKCRWRSAPRSGRAARTS